MEHDPIEIWRNTRRVAAAVLAACEIKPLNLAACGITNQREDHRGLGSPHRSAGLQCDRLAGHPHRRPLRGARRRECGRRRPVPRAHRLAAVDLFRRAQIRWILDNVDGARERADRDELCFGTMDTSLAWNITGGIDGGRHVTDVTNASRTMLMDLHTLEWDQDICTDLNIPLSMLPEICSSSEVIGTLRNAGSFADVPLAGILGDQQAAMFGQACLEPGEAKNTYGTGNFLLLNTGTEPVFSDHGLLTTVCIDWVTSPRAMPWRARSPSPVPWCSGCATTSG